MAGSGSKTGKLGRLFVGGHFCGKVQALPQAVGAVAASGSVRHQGHFVAGMRLSVYQAQPLVRLGAWICLAPGSRIPGGDPTEQIIQGLGEGIVLSIWSAILGLVERAFRVQFITHFCTLIIGFGGDIPSGELLFLAAGTGLCFEIWPLNLVAEPICDAAEGTFNTLGRQRRTGQGGNFFCREPLAVIEPKKYPVPLAHNSRSRAQLLVQLGKQNRLLDMPGRPSAGGMAGERVVIERRGYHFATPLHGALAAEVVVAYRGGHHAQQAQERVLSAGFELSQDAALLIAQLEKDLLHDIVNHGGLGTAGPEAANAQGNQGNEGRAPAHQLSPFGGVSGVGTGLGEIVD
jgi:hypothetical protein